MRNDELVVTDIEGATSDPANLLSPCISAVPFSLRGFGGITVFGGMFYLDVAVAVEIDAGSESLSHGASYHTIDDILVVLVARNVRAVSRTAGKCQCVGESAKDRVTARYNRYYNVQHKIDMVVCN